HQAAGSAPTDIGYLEVLGTGAQSVDATQIEALARAYGEGRDALSCALGSAAATIGYTQAAAGMAALIRTALALHARTIPATPDWTALPAPDDARKNPFYLAVESRPWFL